MGTRLSTPSESTPTLPSSASFFALRRFRPHPSHSVLIPLSAPRNLRAQSIQPPDRPSALGIRPFPQTPPLAIGHAPSDSPLGLAGSREARARAVAAGPARRGHVGQAGGPRQQQQFARWPAPGGARRAAALRTQPVVAQAAAGGGRWQGRAPAAPETQLLVQAVWGRGPGPPAGRWGSRHPWRAR